MTKRIVLAILDFYRYWISPAIHSVLPGGCKYQPTCSQYAIEAVGMHGAFRGGWMALKRLLTCHPFSKGGFDPVPLPAPAISVPGEPLRPGLPACNTSNHSDPLP